MNVLSLLSNPRAILDDPLQIVFYFLFIILAVTVHEFAHAWAADELGDPTARLLGRKSLDPRRHLDMWGSILFVFVGFGWGKPVPVDGYNLKDERKDSALIALAGPVSNLLVTVVLALIFRLVGDSSPYVGKLLFDFAVLNVSLAVFNLLPFPPLDGSRLYRAILPESFSPVFAFLDRYGIYVLLFVFVSGINLFSGFVGPIVLLILRTLGFV